METAPEVSRVDSMHWNRTQARELLRGALAEPAARAPQEIPEEILREVKENIVRSLDRSSER